MSPHPSSRSAALLLATIVLLGACGPATTGPSDGQDEAAIAELPAASDDTEHDTEHDADREMTGEPAPAQDAVAARNIRFEPAELEVTVGTTVTFTNLDIVRHTVTSGSPGEPDGRFDVSLDAQDEATTVTFDEAGAFAYYCDLHPAMVGTITVTAS